MEGESSVSEDGRGSVTFEIEDGAQLVLNEETGEVEVIDLGDPSISQEIEVVTVESTGSSGVYSTTRKLSTSGSTIAVSQNPVHRVKSAPALLRNSRRFQPADQLLGGVSIPTSLTHGGRHEAHGANHLPPVSANYLTKSGRQVPTTSQHISTITSSSSGGFHQSQDINQGGLQHAVVLDENGQETQEYVILAPNESGEYSIVDRGTREIPEQQEYYQTQVDEKIDTSVSFQHQGQTIIICQDPDSNQVSHLMEDADGNLVPVDGSMTYQLDNSTIFSLEEGDVTGFDESGGITVSPLRIAKPKKKAKKPLQVMIGSDGKPLKKKGQTELKCMEKGCIMTCFNVSELRKHLNISHAMNFDEETINFYTENEFKDWRENYERERMVSFIYRGGTKKIAKDQAVTYMICHRSGHYKPTMSDETKRKRKMKPQGSCKMGGYCTAGIKLLKNLDSGIIKMDICHTHYGHPLDSDAIPHLRVNPTLRKIILGKFQEGLSFTEVLAYIHHNPDRLEGLRLVDRRAVRNIFDTWKNPTRRSKKAQKDVDELLADPLLIDLNEIEDESVLEDTREDEDEISLVQSPSNDETQELKNKPICEDLPLLHRATETSEKEDGEKDEDIGPPKLVPVEHRPGKRLIKSKRGRKCAVEDENVDDVSEDSASSDFELLLPVKKEPGLEDSVNRGSYRLRPNRKVEVYSAASSKLKKIQAISDNEQDSEKKSSSRKSKSGGSEKVTQIESRKIKKEKEAEEQEELEPVLISESLEKAIDKLHNHGESGPTVLLYKPVGKPSAKYGDAKRDLRRDDFCVVLQSPVQRQLMQMFPNIIGFEILDGPKSSQSQLKLAFLIVLDEYREAIPVAWLVANSVDTRILGNFFKSIRAECGELRSQYFMTPRNSEAYRLWCSTFVERPKCIQNDIEVRRDLKTLVWQQFGTDKGRREVWDLMESLINVRHESEFKILQEKIDPLVENLPHAGLFRKKFEKDWLSKAEEWSLCHRIRSSVNVIGVSQSFGKLKKFVSFKGTKSLNESFDHILKIGYDKCFLRSKRMFKGDQKFSQYIEDIRIRHMRGRKLQSSFAVMANDETTVIKTKEDKTYDVFCVGSPCECKLVCKHCNVCVHVYLCTCNEYVTTQAMCEHIHFAHCQRMCITEDEPELITGDLNTNADEGEGVFGKIETNGTEENPGAIINIGAVLKAAGLFHRSDGLQPDQIVSITDADTQRILYEHVPSAEVVSTPEVKTNIVVEVGESPSESFADPTNMTETEMAVQSLNTGSEDVSAEVLTIVNNPVSEENPVGISQETEDVVENTSPSTVEIPTLGSLDNVTPDDTNSPTDTVKETLAVKSSAETLFKHTDNEYEADCVNDLEGRKNDDIENSNEDIPKGSPSKSGNEPRIEKLSPTKKNVRRSSRVTKVERVPASKPTKQKKTVSNLKEEPPQPPMKRRRSEVEEVIISRRTSLRRQK